MKPDVEIPKRRFVFEEIYSKTSWNRSCNIRVNPNMADNEIENLRIGTGLVAN